MTRNVYTRYKRYFYRSSFPLPLIGIPRPIVPPRDEWGDPIWPEERVLSMKTTLYERIRLFLPPRSLARRPAASTGTRNSARTGNKNTTLSCVARSALPYVATVSALRHLYWYPSTLFFYMAKAVEEECLPPSHEKPLA